MTSKKTRDMILVALFAALTALGAFIRVPVPFVPFTLQFLFCALSGILLGPWLGMLSQLLYLAVGLAGLPVFSAGGGPGYVLQPTFGYLIGFVAAAWVIGSLFARLGRLTAPRAFCVVYAGLMVVYACGVPWLYLVYRFYLQDPRTVRWALFYGVFACIGGDTLLSVLVGMVSVRLVPLLRGAGLVVSEESL